MSYCQSSEFRPNLKQMIMDSRVKIQELQEVPIGGCLPGLFHRKKPCFPILPNIWYSRLLTFDPLFVAAKTRSTANLKLKSLSLS